MNDTNSNVTDEGTDNDVLTTTSIMSTEKTDLQNNIAFKCSSTEFSNILALTFLFYVRA
jgi:hypothetical protein